MSRPKLVVLTSRFPFPLDKGDKVRVFHQLGILRKFFTVHLICLSANVHDDTTTLQEVCDHVHVFHLPESRSRRQVIMQYLNDTPMQVSFFYDRHIKWRIDQLLFEIGPDWLHCHLIRMAPYCMDYVGCWKSIDYMDSMVLNDLAGQYLNSGWKSVLRATERKKVRAYETYIASHFQARFVISERDRLHFDPVLADSIGILPNGVDLNFFSHEDKKVETHDIVFCGNLGYQPNVLAVNYIIYQLMPLIPAMTFLLAGADIDDRIDTSGTGVTCLGRVDDIRDVYRRGSLMVAPIFTGAGQQNKILEAMAMGVPCITTSFVNQSLGAQDGHDLQIADEPSQFVRLINDLLSHSEKRSMVASNARRFVEKNFDWEQNTRPLVDIINKGIKHE